MSSQLVAALVFFSVVAILVGGILWLSRTSTKREDEDQPPLDEGMHHERRNAYPAPHRTGIGRGVAVSYRRETQQSGIITADTCDDGGSAVVASAILGALHSESSSEVSTGRTTSEESFSGGGGESDGGGASGSWSDGGSSESNASTSSVD